MHIKWWTARASLLSLCSPNEQRRKVGKKSAKRSESPAAGGFERYPLFEVLDVWRIAEAVCFDVDSTVCIDEGIDELADYCGAGKAVAEWTARAMGGSVPFEEALAARLSLFNPSLPQVHDFLHKRPPRLSPGIADLVRMLQSKQKDVYLISGGFRQMIQSSGEFRGFDINEPTSQSGGKAVAVQNIRKARPLIRPSSMTVHGYKALVMIGDGATDLEVMAFVARKPGGADLFICYAGVQLRESVAAKADWLVYKFQDLITSL
ncbi:hypothetical protein ACLOJK_035588 [Asimina triloba]